MVNPVDEEGTELPGLEELPKDPWGRPYGYELIDGKPSAFCLGSEGAEGGEGDETDIYFPERDDF